jgi:hypothetical protein
MSAKILPRDRKRIEVFDPFVPFRRLRQYDPAPAVQAEHLTAQMLSSIYCPNEAFTVVCSISANDLRPMK